MKTILTYIFFCVILAPCLLIFNESHTFIHNIIAFIWFWVLYVLCKTKFGKNAIKTLERLNKRVEDWLLGK